MDDIVWKSGLEGSRSTTRCLLYIEMFFFTVVYFRIIVLQLKIVSKRSGKFESENSPPEPVETGLLLLVAALLLPVLLFEVGVEPVRPLADAANVKREVARLLGRRRYREWMPFARKMLCFRKMQKKGSQVKRTFRYCLEPQVD